MKPLFLSPSLSGLFIKAPVATCSWKTLEKQSVKISWQDGAVTGFVGFSWGNLAWEFGNVHAVFPLKIWIHCGLIQRNIFALNFGLIPLQFFSFNKAPKLLRPVHYPCIHLWSTLDWSKCISKHCFPRSQWSRWWLMAKKASGCLWVKKAPFT